MFASPAYAQLTGSAQGGPSSILMLAVPWVLILGIFWFLVWRPQQRQQKLHRARIEAAKKGDEVVTAGGHIGKVTKVSGDEVEVEFAPGQRHRVLRSTLSEVRTIGTPAND